MSDQIGTASIGLAVDSSGVDAGLNRMEATVERAARTLSSLGQRGAAAVNNVGASANETANSVDRATQRQVRSIQTLTAELQSGGRATVAFQEAIARNRGGEAAVQTLRPYLDQLQRVREAQQAAAQAALQGGQAFNTQSQSAAQLANNLRMVPAQLTDIVTSLQGGQRPITVLLQQGGQLRDMFGSIGGAARALGGYLLSLISPLTVVAAAVAVLAFAYSEGSKEADAFRKSIILTGNAAGVTTSQLANMAKQASDVAGTQGANADALAQLVGTGKVAADQLLAASVTAVQSQKYLGIAVEDTVKAFADLGKDPLQATLKLNEQYNYLTLATYKQLKALTEQARGADAAKLAQTTYGDAMASKNKQVADSLGTLERAWNATGSAAKKSWDFMLNIGRETTIDDRIKAAVEAVKKAKLELDLIGTRFAGDKQDKAEETALRQGQLDEAQRQVDRLQNIKKVGEIKAQYEAEDAKSRDAAIAFDQQGEQFLTRRQKLEKEIAASRNLGQQAAQRGEDPAVTEKNIQDRVAKIRESYAALENQGIEARIAAVQRLGAIQEEQAKRALVVIQGPQEAGQNKALDQQAAYIKAVSDADEQALAREKSRLQQRLALAANETVSVDDQAAHEIKLADLRGEIALKDQQIATRRAERNKDLFVLDVKNNHDIAESYDVLFDSRQSDLNALDQQLQAQKDQNAVIGMTAKQLEEFNTGLVEEKAHRLEIQAAIIGTSEARADEAEVLRKSAARMRELNQAQIEGARKAADFKAYSEFWDSIDKAAKDAFEHIGENGKSMLDRLRDSLKTGLLDLLYQLTVKQFIINVKASVSGDALAGAANAAAAVAGGTPISGGAGVLGNVANALNIYKLTSSAGASITAAGNLFGSAAVSAFGTGLSGGAATAEAAAAYAAAGETAVAGGLTAGAGVSAALAAIPVWGWAALGAAAVASYLGVFDGAGPEQRTHLTFGSNNAPGNISINERGNEGRNTSYIDQFGKSAFGTFGVTNSLWSPSDSEIVQSFIKTVSQTDDALASFLTTTEQSSVTAALTGTKSTAELGPEGSSQNVAGGLDVVFKSRIESILSAVSPGLDKLVSGFTGTSQALATEAQAILQYRQALDQSGEALFGARVTLLDIAALQQPTELASVALKRVAGEFEATNAIASVLGKTSLEAFGAVGLKSEETRKNLITLVGGLDQLSSQTASFSQNFLTDAERLAPVSKALDEALASMNLSTIPQTREQFKNLVQSLDLTTEKGQKTLAALLDVQDAFAQVHPEIVATTTALSNLADQQKEQRSLNIQLLEAMGDAEGALAAKRSDALAALLSDQARVTQAQIYAAQDAKTAADKIATENAAALSKIADQGKEQQSLNIQLMEAQGNAEGALAATRADALKSLLTDQARITQAQIYATQDSQKVYDSLISVSSGALSRLSASINAEKDRINASYTKQEQSIRDATTASVKSAQDSLKAAQTQSSAIQSVFNSLGNALGSTKIESDAATLARRQAAQAVITGAVANPGNLANNKALTEALSTITGQSNDRLFGTFEEYARDQARTNNAIAALRDTAGTQVDQAQAMVDLQESTIEAIQKNGESQIAKLEEDKQAQLDRLDQTLAVQTAQLDALKGISTSILSLSEAMAGFRASISQLQSNPTAIGTSQTGAIENLYQTLLGRQSDPGGLAFYNNAASKGTTIDEIKKAIMSSVEYQKTHSSTASTAYYDPSQAPRVTSGGQIIPSVDTSQMMALMGRVTDPTQNSSALLGEVQRLSDIMDAQATTLNSIADSSGMTAGVLNDAQKGRPIATMGG